MGAVCINNTQQRRRGRQADEGNLHHHTGSSSDSTTTNLDKRSTGWFMILALTTSAGQPSTAETRPEQTLQDGGRTELHCRMLPHPLTRPSTYLPTCQEHKKAPPSLPGPRAILTLGGIHEENKRDMTWFHVALGFLPKSD